MISQDDVINSSITEYSFLSDVYGFKGPRIKKVNWLTQINYLTGELAVQIRLDFRDLVVDLFIVRLEDGKLPKRYYLSAGRKTRMGLLPLIADKNWSVDEVSLRKLQTKTNRADRGDSTYFKEELRNYRLVLISCIEKILEQRANLFN